jgi:hypothetical protein
MARGTAFGVRGADRVEESDQLVEVALAQRRHRRLVCRVNLRVELVEELLAGVGDATDNLTAIRNRALASDQARRLEAIENARDRRPFLDHPIADRKGRDTTRARAANDAEGVVLGEAQSVRVDDARNGPSNNRRRAEEGNRPFLPSRSEWLSLTNLAANAKW